MKGETVPEYVFIYRAPLGFEGAGDSAGDWMTWFDAMGPALKDMGEPVFTRELVGNCDGGTQLGGYTMITANSLEEATSLAQGCPFVVDGIGGVEVGELTPVSSLP
jgi:hypothetical protein